jgi:hypothetical protein
MGAASVLVCSFDGPGDVVDEVRVEGNGCG